MQYGRGLLTIKSGRSLECVEYGYPKRSPNTRCQGRNSPLQLSTQCSPQHTYKRPSSELHGAIAKSPAKGSVYQILSVIVVFVVLVCEVQFVSLIPKSHNN
jgi:hypothetical protein